MDPEFLEWWEPIEARLDHISEEQRKTLRCVAYSGYQHGRRVAEAKDAARAEINALVSAVVREGVAYDILAEIAARGQQQ